MVRLGARPYWCAIARVAAMTISGLRAYHDIRKPIPDGWVLVGDLGHHGQYSVLIAKVEDGEASSETWRPLGEVANEILEQIRARRAKV